MKELHKFSLAEWAKLLPLTQAIKQFRNDLQLFLYLGKKIERETELLAELQSLRSKNLLVVIAFEQPLALHWLLTMAQRHIPDFTLLVFDNSKSSEARAKILKVCTLHATPYIPLPENKTRHVNRSHGLAMTWAYEHVIRSIQPEIFGFIDHDMIPIAPISLESHLVDQGCYGLINTGFACWNLWAGFCLYRYHSVENIKMNYLYDFSRGLDTGGRNWRNLYSTLDKSKLKFAPEEFRDVSNVITGSARTVQVVDQSWLHIGGIGYNNNFDEKRKFFTDYFDALGISPLQTD